MAPALPTNTRIPTGHLAVTSGTNTGSGVYHRLVNAAKDANVNRFLFVSFRRTLGISFPLGNAKEQIEEAVKGLNFTVIQASWFMEVWLSPALGFDYAKAEARIYGAGTSPISWVSYRDVAEICAVAVRHPAAMQKTIEFGGPEALSPHEVVARFETIGGTPFRMEHISEQTLLAQFEGATDPLPANRITMNPGGSLRFVGIRHDARGDEPQSSEIKGP